MSNPVLGAKVDRFLADTYGEQLAFARRLISTPSPNPPGDERAVAGLVIDKLRNLGIGDVEVLCAEPSRPNLVARISGESPGKSLILSGHLDTKPPGDISRWRVAPYDAAVFGGELYGLGSGDMKAAVAAIVYAGAALARNRGWSGELILVLTADEEAGSNLGSKWLAEEGLLEADGAIVGEPCGVVREWETIGAVSRGSALFDIEVQGTQMHSSVSDRFDAVNATVEMAWLIAKMHHELLGELTYRTHPLGELKPTVNIGVMVEGGVFYGVYPGLARFSSDIRMVPGMTGQTIEADLQRFLDRAQAQNPRLNARLDIVGTSEATEIPLDHPLVIACQKAAKMVLKSKVEAGVFPAATDALSFQGIAGIPTVAAFGPGLVPRAHAPNERLGVHGINQAAGIYAHAALDFLDGCSSSSVLRTPDR